MPPDMVKLASDVVLDPKEIEAASKGGGRNGKDALWDRLRKVFVKDPPPPETLDDILNGKTCTPLSLSEFREYLEKKEYSAENLDVYEWYQAYRKRFFSLPPETQSLSPPPTLLPSTPPSKSSIDSQPLRSECTAALKHFFSPSGDQEVNVPFNLLKILRRNAEVTTHPDVFEPAVKHIVHLMQSSSLPKFLNGAARNIGSWREIGWRWLWGCIWLSGAVILMIILLRFHVSRWVRILTFPFIYMSSLYIATSQTQLCFTYMGRRQREVLITELEEATPLNTADSPKAGLGETDQPYTEAELQFGVGRTPRVRKPLRKGLSVEEIAEGKPKGLGKGKVIGRILKAVEEPVVLKVQQDLKRKVLVYGAIASTLVLAGLLGIPENAWE